MVRVVFDEERCIGAGQCVRWAPAYFDQDEETGLVQPRGQVIDAEFAGVQGAVKACPSGAIQLSG